MFTKAIVRQPCRNMTKGLTSANLGAPDFERAVAQHGAYVSALKSCGLQVKELEADERYPDSTFIEDTALLTPHCAIITNPGAPSRRGEVAEMKGVLQEYYTDIEEISAPGTVDAGDIMMVGSHFYIGLSGRTNKYGAEEVIRILNRYGMSGFIVELTTMLHLKTGLSSLERNTLLVAGEFLQKPEFKKFNVIAVPDGEGYAANCIWINDTVIIPEGYPVVRQKVRDAGYATIEVDVSEFRKLDGGLSCLSLRF